MRDRFLWGEGRYYCVKVYPCPLCGRWKNRQGVEFTDKSQTVAHITGAHDEAHADERGENHMSAIEPTDVESADESSDSSDRPTLKEEVDMLWDSVMGHDSRVAELSEENDRLRDRVDELEELVEAMRGDLAGLYAALDDEGGRYVAKASDSSGWWVPESIDARNPTKEFEEN